LHELRVPLGYWEAKHEEDDLDKEIEKTFRKGYPQDNILFEDSYTAVLVQNQQEVIRCGVDDRAKLEKAYASGEGHGVGRSWTGGPLAQAASAALRCWRQFQGSSWWMRLAG
jgi:hypothetical protein